MRQTGCSCLGTKLFRLRGRVSIVRLMCWVNQHTAWANYHLCMKLSGDEQLHTQCAHMCTLCVCACEYECVSVSECQTHHCVSAWCCLFFLSSRTPTCRNLLLLPLNPQRHKCKNKTKICQLSLHFSSVVTWMACQIFLHSNFHLGVYSKTVWAE